MNPGKPDPKAQLSQLVADVDLSAPNAFKWNPVHDWFEETLGLAKGSVRAKSVGDSGDFENRVAEARKAGGTIVVLPLQDEDSLDKCLATIPRLVEKKTIGPNEPLQTFCGLDARPVRGVGARCDCGCPRRNGHRGCPLPVSSGELSTPSHHLTPSIGGGKALRVSTSGWRFRKGSTSAHTSTPRRRTKPATPRGATAWSASCSEAMWSSITTERRRRLSVGRLRQGSSRRRRSYGHLSADPPLRIHDLAGTQNSRSSTRSSQ